MAFPYTFKHAKLAYTAGIVDGEGSIMIMCSRERRGRIGKCYQLRIAVTNTNEWLLHWLRFNYGGSVIERNKWKPLQTRRTWDWIIANKQAGEFLKLISPYLQMKKQQAELGLLFQSKKRRGGIKTDKQFVLEESQQILMRGLNKTGGII